MRIINLHTVFPGWYDWPAVSVNQYHVLFDHCVSEGQQSVPRQLVLSETQCISLRDDEYRVPDLFGSAGQLLSERWFLQRPYTHPVACHWWGCTLPLYSKSGLVVCKKVWRDCLVYFFVIHSTTIWNGQKPQDKYYAADSDAVWKGTDIDDLPLCGGRPVRRRSLLSPFWQAGRHNVMDWRIIVLPVWNTGQSHSGEMFLLLKKYINHKWVCGGFKF